MPYRGRFAPSPTGMLHAGSLVAALASWLRARQLDGAWLVRVDDIDPPREKPGSAAAILAGLERLDLVADGTVMYQSTRDRAYQAALEELRRHDLAFPCWCSRSDLASLGGIHRDGHCVRAAESSRMPAWRMRVNAGEVCFDDLLQGRQSRELRDSAGDFVLRRADGYWAYQLTCAVDDAHQGITEVVRGVDLLDSTARQIYLQRALGLPTPRYAHIPLMVDANGRKLSKSAADQPLDGWPAAELLKAALGCLAIPREALAGAAGVAQLLARATQAFDITHLQHVDQLRFPPR